VKPQPELPVTQTVDTTESAIDILFEFDRSDAAGIVTGESSISTLANQINQTSQTSQVVEIKANNKTDLYQQCDASQRNENLIRCLGPNRRVNVDW